MTARAFVGMAGWTFAPWRGDFYPEGLRQKDELAHAASRLSSLEINGTFYSMQKPGSWMTWRDAVPDDFVFSVKGPRFITHVRGLDDVREPLANLFASGILALGPKLGPILWQLPPDHEYDERRTEAFLALLPTTTGEALELAQERSERMTGREHLEIGADRPLRHAFEPRSATFDDPAFAAQLERHGAAAVFGDSDGRWPRLDWVTADFAYARLHAHGHPDGYRADELEAWQEWAEDHLDHDRDAFLYCDDEVKTRSPHDAVALAALLA